MKIQSLKRSSSSFKQKPVKIEQISRQASLKRSFNFLKIKNQISQIKQEVEQKLLRKELKSLKIDQVQADSIYQFCLDDLRSTDCCQILDEELKLQSMIKNEEEDESNGRENRELQRSLGVSSITGQNKGSEIFGKYVESVYKRHGNKNKSELKCISNIQIANKKTKKLRLTKSELTKPWKQSFKTKQLLQLAKFQIKNSRAKLRMLKHACLIQG